MFITHVISYKDGWDYLLKQKPDGWRDIAALLSRLDTVLRDLVANHRPNHTHPHGIDASLINFGGEYLLKDLGWEPRHYRTHEEFSQRKWYRKNRVGARFGSIDLLSERITDWFLIDVPRAKDANECDVSLLLLPMETLVSSFHVTYGSSGFSFEDCRTLLSDLPIRHGAAFAIIGFGAQDAQLSISQIQAGTHISSDTEFVERSIEFPPQYYQAGVSILSYFGEVLKQKHPGAQAKVRIEQDGLTVRLQIESASGDKEIIEKTLEQYGMCIAKQLPLEALFDSRLQIIALEQKLELAKMEVRHTHQLLALADEGYSHRIRELQGEVHHLRSYIGQHLLQAETLHRMLGDQCEANERLMLAQVSHAETLVRDLMRQTADNRVLLDALSVIDQKLNEGAGPADEKAVKQALAVIQQEKPAAVTQLRAAFANLSYEVSGSYLFKWIEAFIATLQ